MQNQSSDTFSFQKIPISVLAHGLICFISFSDYLLLNNTGPAVFDVPILFFAELTDFEDGENLLWHWSDDNGHSYSVCINYNVCRTLC